jgi:hypothetical protein
LFCACAIIIQLLMNRILHYQLYSLLVYISD